MTAMPVRQRMTADQFLAERYDEAKRGWELIDGEVVVNEPTMLHNVVAMNLIVALSDWTRAEAGRGRMFIPLDVQLDDLNVFAPDISWYSVGRVLDVHAPPPYPVPDLAAEIRSPSTWRYDIGAKKSTYERQGLPELWLVDTAAAEALVFRRSEGSASFDLSLELTRGETLESPLLPGLVLPLDELFDVG